MPLSILIINFDDQCYGYMRAEFETSGRTTAIHFAIKNTPTGRHFLWWLLHLDVVSKPFAYITIELLCLRSPQLEVKDGPGLAQGLPVLILHERQFIG
jgi:hypothetical protein